MIQMGTDEEKGDDRDNNIDKPYDEISELLKKYYKPTNETAPDIFWEKVSKKIDSLFHKELYSEKILNRDGSFLSEEERYWLGLEEYLKNELSSLRHKAITDHLLNCKECRQNYNELLNKKKPMIDLKNLKFDFYFEKQLN